MKLYLRAMYSKFSDNENRDRFDVTNTGTASFVTAPTAAQFSRVRGDRLVRRREEDDNTRTLSGGGEFKLGAGTLTAEGVYSKAEKTDPLRSEFAFRSGNVTAAVPVDLSAFLYKVTAPTQLFDPSLYNFRSVNYDKREATEALTQARADYLLPVMGDSSLKFGVKYLERKKKNDRNIDNYTAGSQAFTLAPLDASSVSDIYDGRYPFGPRVIYNSAQAFVTANPNSISRVANTSLSTSLLSDYDVNEKVTAAYAMGTFKVFDKWTFIPGVRVEHTDGSYSTKSYIASTNSQGPNIEGSKDYTDVFPGINVRFNATDQLVFRGAITTAISRPGYTTNNGISGGVVPIVSVDTTTNVVTLGNADLKELHAVNFDFAMEYYLPGHGVVSLAAFDKMIDDPIYSQVSTQSGTFGGVAVTNAVVTRPVNAKSASLRGLEANWQMQFIDLPSFWNGFGVALNATMISAHADGVPTSALNAPLRDRVPLINQSNRVASFQVFYEKYGFTGRFAYSYRSRYMDGVGPDAAHDTFVADHGEADARVAYAINRNAEVFVEGSNLTNAPWRRYIGNRHQMVENEQYGPAGRVGFTIRR